MGLSTASLNPIQGVSYRSVVPQSYTVSNEADFSDAFTDSVKDLSSADSVMGPTPVQYPTATLRTKQIGQIEANQKINDGLNSIAMGFEGRATGYNSGGFSAMGYGMVGSRIDLFA